MKMLVVIELVLNVGWLTLEDTLPAPRVLKSRDIRTVDGVLNLDAPDERASGALLSVANLGEVKLTVSSDGGPGFHGATPPATKPIASGSRTGNAALASPLYALESLGLLTDTSTPRARQSRRAHCQAALHALR